MLKPQLRFPGESVLTSYFNLRSKSLCYRRIDPVSLLLAKVPCKSSSSTYDFSTLYTTLPHNPMKEKLLN